MGGQKMKEIIVYHDGTEIVEHPNCRIGRRNLDFGQGFYVTDISKQAVDWARLVADKKGKHPVLNRYRMKRDEILANDRVVDTVNLYIAGLMDEETALRRLSEHRPNNQMCLLSQELTDKYLIFDGTDDI